MPNTQDQPTKLVRLLAGLAIVALTLAVFGQVAGFDIVHVVSAGRAGQPDAHEFVNFDDPDYVSDNQQVASGLNAQSIGWAFRPQAANWIPLTWLSLMFDAELFGVDARAYHRTNLLLHVANALLLFAILCRWTSAPGLSAFVAALFAVHPLHVESVVWVAERKDVLSTLFGLLALAAYGRYARTLAVRWYVAALLAFALSLMAKQMLVTLPFLLLLLDDWPLERTSGTHDTTAASGAAAATAAATGKRCLSCGWTRLIAEKIPFLLLSLAASMITFLVQQQGGAVQSFAHYPLTMRIANAAVVYLLYLEKAFWPVELAVYYPYPPGGVSVVVAILAALLLIAITLAVLWYRARHRYLLVGWFWYLGTLVPVIGLVQVGGQRMADRYTYVPLIGIFLGLTWLVWSLVPAGWWRRRMLPALAILLLAGLSGLAWRQTATWRNSITLYEHALATVRPSVILHSNFAAALLDAQQYEQASLHCREATRLKPRFAAAHSIHGRVLIAQQRYDEAIGQFRQLLQIDPDYPEAHNNLGVALEGLGRIAEAEQQYRKELTTNPEHAVAHFNLGNTLLAQGRYADASACYQESLRIEPESATTHSNLGAALQLMGQIDEATRHYREALRIDPELEQARKALAALTKRRPKEPPQLRR